ncbi:hypothetical protein L226DRAFT_562990 [Lentinus tigrinus ALCF2SS1-7]|uniref:Uncharacterized protein n=1 Tax=Lentinus tigrinus ALCF2SS1-6 TaxID=1328759 RepID=A0A5C2RVY8_9APHY|nr:hypothetical protein L227DRAFT_603659 [Lentinus tigrinus ALCF2SS1-6]RPD70139.1 hypothetical protein L226DRAFT_562990 [Lentinus tigrinus ALCF2SS1-7]
MAIPLTPAAPQLTQDAHLIVFVHHSAQQIAPQNHPVFGDCNRLAQLGRPMLEAAYMDAMRQRFPNLHGDVFAQYVNGEYPNFVARWVTAYGWRGMMRRPPNVNLNDQHAVADGAPVMQETLRIFETYAGAVVAQQANGQAVLFEWIQRLVNMP